MKYCEAKTGRVFVLRLEQGEVLHEVIENFADDKNIEAAALIVVGGADEGSTLIVGPRNGEARPVEPMERALEDVREIAGTGTLFPDERGRPVLHMHIACGRGDSTVTGCVRRGVRIWQIAEVIIFELKGSAAVRRYERESGFTLLKLQ